MNPERIRLLVTGGTFDKEYNELTGTLFFKDTHLPEMLRLGRSRVDLAIETLMMIDSLEMTGADRTLIVEQCRAATDLKRRRRRSGGRLSPRPRRSCRRAW